MNTIYIIDYLGNHCGMHYYNAAFREVLLPCAPVRILSNYPDGECASFFRNQYKGGKFTKIRSLLVNLFRLRRFSRKHPEEVLIYLDYGNAIDLLYMWTLGKRSGVVIDIHEAIAQNVDSKEWLKRCFARLFHRRIKTVIAHSDRTERFLDTFGFTGMRFRVPHFRYSFARDLDETAIDTTVRDAVATNKKKVLFFGNLNENKGIDRLMEAFNGLKPETASGLALIIAGKDNDGSVHRIAPKEDREWHFLIRHISDDELIFLYQNADYIALPYRKTSQSGILEMAFYFRKPVLVSDLPYFRSTLEEFPSFGRLSDDFQALLASLPSDSNNYFASADVDRYENRKEVKLFLESFTLWLERRK